jgi:hypothetical protein
MAPRYNAGGDKELVGPAYDNFHWCPDDMRMSPAMVAGMTNRLWLFDDLIAGGLGSARRKSGFFLRGDTMAGMARPQFTLRDLLVSISYLAMSLGSFRAAIVLDDSIVIVLALLLTGIVFLGTGIGALCQNPVDGSVLGAAGALMLLFCVILASIFAA